MAYYQRAAEEVMRELGITMVSGMLTEVGHSHWWSQRMHVTDFWCTCVRLPAGAQGAR